MTNILSKVGSMLNLLTNFFLKILSYSNGLIQHNIEKNKAIRLIFWWAAVENVIGDYVEFGVATGNSIKGAVLAEAKAHSKKLFIKRVERNIYMGSIHLRDSLQTAELIFIQIGVGLRFQILLRMSLDASKRI
jgi:hypothetical protein